jgi:hypothetical protein
MKMPSTISNSSAGNEAANQVYLIVSAIYTALSSAGVQISGVTITEPPTLQAQIVSAVQAIRTS